MGLEYAQANNGDLVLKPAAEGKRKFQNLMAVRIRQGKNREKGTKSLGAGVYYPMGVRARHDRDWK